MSDRILYSRRMNLNRAQFEMSAGSGLTLLAELKDDYPELRLYPVFARFGPGSGQCGLTTDIRKIVVEFPEMLVPSDDLHRLRELLFEISKAGRANDDKLSAKLEKKAGTLERKLLAPELPLYCGDVNIEFRTGVLKYEPLRRLQQDPRLPPGLNTVGNIRVIAGSLEWLTTEAGT